MIRDITIGQYYPADSILHRLDPRVKISGTFLYLISLFLFKSVLGYVIAGCFLAAVIWLSKVQMCIRDSPFGAEASIGITRITRSMGESRSLTIGSFVSSLGWIAPSRSLSAEI